MAANDIPTLVTDRTSGHRWRPPQDREDGRGYAAAVLGRATGRAGLPPEWPRWRVCSHARNQPGCSAKAQVQAGQKVLIIGASGGVGTFAVQIAKAFGAEVTGVCSTAKTDLVRAIGADHVIDYTREDFADGQHRYDVILDIGGTSRLSHLRRALTPRGRLVMIGGESGGRWLGGMDRLLRAHLLFPLVSQKLSTFIASENSADLKILRDLIESGTITPAIDRTYPLSQTPAAIRHVQEGRARGKVVITI